MVAVGSFDGTARLFDAQSGELLHSYAGHAGAVQRAIVTPDGARILTSSDDGTARLWDLATASEVRRFVHTDVLDEFVEQSVMSTDLRRVYTAGTDATVRGWKTSGEDFSYRVGEGEVASLSFSSDGSRIASAAGGTIRVFDRTADDFALDVAIEDIQRAVFSPDDASILAVSGNQVALLDATTGEEVRLLVKCSTGCARWRLQRGR